MGNQQIQLILVVLIFLVSLLSSVDVIRGSDRLHFAKVGREQKTALENVKSKQSTVDTALESPPPPPPAQPLFYQQSNKDNNPHGLNPHTHTPPPPPPPPPPPHHHHGFGFPNNYDPNYYVTRADNTAEKPAIIEEDEKKELQANKYDFLDEDEDEDEEDEKFEDLDNFDSKPPPPHGPSSRYVYNPTFTTTKTDNYKTKYAPTPVGPPPLQRGMSDTNFMENGKWAYDLGTETFTSTEHPFNQVANQQNTIEEAEDEDPFNDQP